MNALDLVSSIGSTIGSTTSSVAKRIGSGTADLAVGAGRGTASLAKTIGPKRGLIGLATLGALIGGGIILGKFLQRRAHEAESILESDKARSLGDKVANSVNRRVRRAKAKVNEATSY